VQVSIRETNESEPYIKLWVEKKVRRHLMRARGRKGFGWKRWSTQWLYNTLGLFDQYRVVRAIR
jgi:RNA-directed DNA polymerase